MPTDLIECLHETRGEIVEFASVIAGKLVEDVAAFAGYAQDGAAGVAGIDRALEQVFALGAVDKLDDAIVLQLEASRSVGDGDGSALGRTGNLQKQLMLLGLQPGTESG